MLVIMWEQGVAEEGWFTAKLNFNCYTFKIIFFSVLSIAAIENTILAIANVQISNAAIRRSPLSRVKPHERYSLHQFT